jgi:hypothetical protein
VLVVLLVDRLLVDRMVLPEDLRLVDLLLVDVTILTGKTLDSAVMTTRAEKYH